MTPNRISFVFAALIVAFAAPMMALGQAANPPTTAPTRHVAVAPAGFHIIVVNGRNIICQPSDDNWVKDAVANIKPATRPSTMPSDIIDNVNKNRDLLTKEVMADFALTDPKPLNDMLDGTLIDGLQKLGTVRPSIFYLIVSKKQLADLMDKGWEDPHFHYIRFANEVEYNNNLAFSLDSQTDDQVMWAPVLDDDTEAVKKNDLSTMISQVDGAFMSYVSILGQQGVRNSLLKFIRDDVMAPLKLQPSEAWFAESIAQVYSIKYVSLLTGLSRDSMLNELLTINPRNPLHPLALDLVTPLDPSGMRADMIPYYTDAVVRKGSYIIYQWVSRGGEGVVAKTLPSLRAFSPRNSADLIKAVQESTGYDLTPAMLPSGQ